MGQLIKFPSKATKRYPRTKDMLNASTAKKKDCEVLFFTGVRYERTSGVRPKRLGQPGHLN